jgi:hypothetical protein
VYRSANGTSAPAPNRDHPTAMQTFGDGQDTPLRPADFVPAGCAARWIVHLPLLLHRSASGTLRLVKYDPTAMQVVLTMQESLSSWLSWARGGGGTR